MLVLVYHMQIIIYLEKKKLMAKILKQFQWETLKLLLAQMNNIDNMEWLLMKEEKGLKISLK
jgi:hypothetical protein